MLQQIICSGFGGQGVLTTGMLIAFAGISLFNCIGFSDVGLSVFGFSNIGLSDVGFLGTGLIGCS